jgi:SMI1/KNR4 family protein SUKH-1
MWRDLVSTLYADAKFREPASRAAIESLERELHVAIPDDLKALLAESNGVTGAFGTALVWSAEETLAQNELFRTDADFRQLYMPFDCLLFFGDAGDGDQFAYRVLDGRIPDTSWIFRWVHESDNREWYASDLEDYFRRSVAPA